MADDKTLHSGQSRQQRASRSRLLPRPVAPESEQPTKQSNLRSHHRSEKTQFVPAARYGVNRKLYTKLVPKFTFVEDSRPTAETVSQSNAPSSSLLTNVTPFDSEELAEPAARLESPAGVRKSIDAKTRASILQRSCRLPSEVRFALLRPPEDQMSTVFPHKADRRSFDYWRREIMSELLRYHTPHWNFVQLEIFPRFALASSPVRHMLLSYAYVHEGLRLRNAPEAKDLCYKAACHYQYGLREMSSTSSKLEILIAALFAFSYDDHMLQNKAASIHRRGMRAILQQEELENDSDEACTIKEYLPMVLHHFESTDETLQTATLPTIPDEDLECVEQARNEILELIDRVEKQESGLDIDRIRTTHFAWVTKMRSFDLVSPQTLNRDAVFIFGNLFWGSLASTDRIGQEIVRDDLVKVNWYACFDTATLYFSRSYQQTHNMLDESDLLLTLSHVAIKLAQHASDQEQRGQAELLLQKIEGRQAEITSSSIE